mmetsp:Transcript_36966/g.73159  ORF Transcript_36966/g.73159 Transcript_36966/m.73159 type:complete len:137 (+) Transcript_36966:762-1172(+)
MLDNPSCTKARETATAGVAGNICSVAGSPCCCFKVPAAFKVTGDITDTGGIDIAGAADGTDPWVYDTGNAIVPGRESAAKPATLHFAAARRALVLCHPCLRFGDRAMLAEKAQHSRMHPLRKFQGVNAVSPQPVSN